MKRLIIAALATLVLFGCSRFEHSADHVALQARAMRGDPQALADMGLVLEKGRFNKPDLAEAARYYREAAEKGNADGQYRLGVLYTNGQGVPLDLVEAYVWLTLSAAGPATTETAQSLYVRERLAERMTAEQVAEATRRAAAFRPKD